ncbi:MAG: hypothetical protein LBQ06_04200, partial [Frankiaceae bacterium]|nr:hypothetical protein [Frankiaceae bacterium]
MGMALDIRRFAGERDTAALADLLNRNNYWGPAWQGQPLAPASLAATLHERCALLTLVGLHRGRIVGSIGFFRDSRRKVAGPQECYAGMFVIDAGHRNGQLAGALFAAGFEHIVEAGVRVLRTDVNLASA